MISSKTGVMNPGILNPSTLLSDPIPAKDADAVEVVLKQAETLSNAWTG
jgi:hypothetical protein